VVLAYRFLPESKDENVDDKPDLVGALLLAVAVGAVALALVKVPAWGWGSRWFLGLVAISLLCVASVVLRSSRHPVPVVDLALLKSRTFSGSFVASVFYYGGFGAFVLNTVEFLTGVWHFSAIEAGLAIAPGPLVVLPFARVVAPRLAQRLGGPGRVAVIGCLVNAAAQFIWLTHLQVHSAYASHLLPVQLLGGMGVGLTIPSLLGAGTASIPPARFGTGSGILNMGRQIGTVLGVAALVAILTTVVAQNPLPAFRHGVLLITGFFLVAGAVSAVSLGARTVARTSSPEATAATSSP
jgi:MFS family permease